MSASELEELRDLYATSVDETRNYTYRGYDFEAYEAEGYSQPNGYSIKDDGHIIRMFNEKWMQHTDFYDFTSVIDTWLDTYEEQQ